ncbi:MAG: short-chain fatty acid transporter [Myxococcaceae bacterium]
MDTLVRVADGLGRWTARWVPSSFAIAVLLTMFTWCLALVWAATPLPVVIAGWAGGFWELLSFSMEMALVMFTGYLLALTRPVRFLLEKIASFAKTPRKAVVTMALASMGLAYINWGLSIVASAMLVRFVVKRQRDVDYRLLVACAYFGLGATWHAGLSASAPLLVAKPKHFLSEQLGQIPISETIFSRFNLLLLLATMAVLTFMAFAMHPKPERTVRVPPDVVPQLGVFEAPVAPKKERTFATFMDHSRLLNVILGGAGLIYFVCAIAFRGMEGYQQQFLINSVQASNWSGVFKGALLDGGPGLLHGWAFLDIDTVNFLFLSLAILLHRTPAALLKASEEAATVLSGIVLQFPLYAGIYGVFKTSGLTDRIGHAFVSISTQRTFPAIVYLYSGIVNYFVPSGGAKWAIEAPYLINAAKSLNVPPAKVVLAYAWGDMATDLIQPFWALPLLSVAKLEFKDILGFLLLAFMVYVPLVTLAFFIAG